MIWVERTDQATPVSVCHAFQAQGGESQQEAQRLQAQLNELQAQLNQKEQAAEHYKLQVRGPQPWPTAQLLAPQSLPTPSTPPSPSARVDGKGQDPL